MNQAKCSPEMIVDMQDIVKKMADWVDRFGIVLQRVESWNPENVTADQLGKWIVEFHTANEMMLPCMDQFSKLAEKYPLPKGG